ncbi:o-succinylbenzoate synthase [Marinilabilia rubra]|uniref:O-succinylbenzoate synthase n=1 Tax=Marinilabilia rubra TaxID=2162893 RepID=A0A2U2B6J1_9BACT|nr:o-succinylbenzoate synthase [Marinilabilia rubra]PWD98666.1 o-succinylbenzoate synthase [Marinilabilia rubra]
MLKADFIPHTLKFKIPGGTSRGVLTEKPSWFISVWDDSNPKIKGTGEISLLPKLSPDARPDIEEKIKEVCTQINNYNDNFHEKLIEWPAIRFGLETALLDLQNNGNQTLFNSDFGHGLVGIPINGLIWMDTKESMEQQIQEKLNAGFKCLKMKIGALDFEEEYSLLKNLRKKFPADKLELRVDANGAFSLQQAPKIMDRLARLGIHSIEQPIQAGQWQEMARLCETTPLPIALDEELIGINTPSDKRKLLSTIKPAYIILKPSLVGGMKASEEWIKMAEELNSGWWITSALESNIGLNAIAQWTSTLNNPMPQGLGTGLVFTNNIENGLFINNGMLWHLGH